MFGEIKQIDDLPLHGESEEQRHSRILLFSRNKGKVKISSCDILAIKGN